MQHSSLFRGSIGPALFFGVLPFAAHAQSAVITSCVSKLTNLSRIVPSAASCNANTDLSAGDRLSLRFNDISAAAGAFSVSARYTVSLLGK